MLDRQVAMIEEQKAAKISTIVSRSVLIGQLQAINFSKCLPEFIYKKYVMYIRHYTEDTPQSIH